MRSFLGATVGLAVLAAGCGGGGSGTTGATGGNLTSGGGQTTGATGGANAGGPTGGGTTGGTTGGLAAGAPCTSDSACASDVCGVSGSGNCCLERCSTTDATCGATACGDTGTCTFPAQGGSCGAATCTDAMSTPAGQCDGLGTCTPGTASPCPTNFGCNSAGTACNTTCTGSTDCASGFVCNNKACVVPAGVGTCTENDDCISGSCGISGMGNCCTTACGATADPACNPTACDVLSGACIYPEGNSCGTDSCLNNKLIASACTAAGACTPSPTVCPNNFACNSTGTACDTVCAATTDCASGFFCVVDAGACDAQATSGACTENDACVSNVCGIAGSGNCCTKASANTTAPCGATDCDIKSAACVYPGSSVTCGTQMESCTGSTQQNPSACDGTGSCNANPGTTDCTPFICGANACLASCTDDSSCGTGDFCDVADATCCDALGLTVAVDSVNGSDSTPCCGGAKTGACQTIGHAMKLIDSAQAQNITIVATVKGAGGDWAPKGEAYPIVLGWGVELSAPGVYFDDSANPANNELFDVNFYSANDMVGYASIAGSAASQAWIGMDTLGDQATDLSVIQVEASNTLYIANASVNGSANQATTALTVAAGGTLMLGQDQAAGVMGTVTIGNPNNAAATDGYNGIVCTTANSQGCTISDATLVGSSSLIIEGQEGIDIDAEDFASISLTSAPVIGVAPKGGFDSCPGKPDVSSLIYPEAILLNGDVTMTFENGTVQCISGAGFWLQASGSDLPTLTLQGTTIQNTELAVYASAGTATISGTTIQYNYNGVEQDTDGTNVSTIDLNGGVANGNTVICSASAESVYGPGGSDDIPAVSVLNTTTQTIDASNVTWDTKSPDEFTCNAALDTCTCEVTTCTNAGGVDGMNAVYESTGTVTTTGNGLSNANCASECGPTNPCPGGHACCRSIKLGGMNTCSQGNFCPG